MFSNDSAHIRAASEPLFNASTTDLKPFCALIIFPAKLFARFLLQLPLIVLSSDTTLSNRLLKSLLSVESCAACDISISGDSFIVSLIYFSPPAERSISLKLHIAAPGISTAGLNCGMSFITESIALTAASLITSGRL